MQQNYTWQRRLIALTGGSGLALLLMASAIAHAEQLNKCQQCRNYWGWWASVTPYVKGDKDDKYGKGGCKDYVGGNHQGDNMGTCIAYVIETKCKTICDANPVPVDNAECTLDTDIKIKCDAFKPKEEAAPCTIETFGAPGCDQTDTKKICGHKQVNQGSTVIMPSVCYVRCECQSQ